jgi:hypothetical protein
VSLPWLRLGLGYQALAGFRLLHCCRARITFHALKLHANEPGALCNLPASAG